MTLDAAELDRTKIRRLNDRFRHHGVGNGSLMITQGVQARGGGFALRAHEAVRAFDSFSEDNDPHGEHDFGAFDLEGERLFWKIDYYDQTFVGHSENAADGAVTHRVLTIMLASEY